MLNKQYDELKRNTIIIAIANVGSRAINFVLAPMYSYYLSTEQYGTMDLIVTAIGLITPLVCLDIYEATFRITSDKNSDKRIVFSSSFLFTIGLTIIVLGIIFLVTYDSMIISIALLGAALESNIGVLSQFARGIGKMKIFAFSGIANSLIIFLLNIFFLVILQHGLYGWAIGYLVAKFLVCIFLFVAINGWKFFSIKKISKSFYIEAFKYALPLIPTTTMWWIMNVSDRYMILYYIGASANGIYAVANKLPALLSIFENNF